MNQTNIRSRFKVGDTVTVRDAIPWDAKVVSMRLRMEDEKFVYIVKDFLESDHVETRPEMDLYRPVKESV